MVRFVLLRGALPWEPSTRPRRKTTERKRHTMVRFVLLRGALPWEQTTRQKLHLGREFEFLRQAHESSLIADRIVTREYH